MVKLIKQNCIQIDPIIINSENKNIAKLSYLCYIKIG